mgnify:CR=1 FL=1
MKKRTANPLEVLDKATKDIELEYIQCQFNYSQGDFSIKGCRVFATKNDHYEQKNSLLPQEIWAIVKGQFLRLIQIMHDDYANNFADELQEKASVTYIGPNSDRVEDYDTELALQVFLCFYEQGDDIYFEDPAITYSIRFNRK